MRPLALYLTVRGIGPIIRAADRPISQTQRKDDSTGGSLDRDR